MAYQDSYRIGIDVGDRSVGFAIVRFADGVPSKILHSISYRHDGGIDPTTNKTPQSRKATAGVARRTRRMYEQRGKRLRKLDELLTEHGFPVEDVSGGETYEPWQARAACVDGYIEDEAERKRLVSRSLRHIARHRGWRNPWHTISRELDSPTPTGNHQKNVADAQQIFPGEIGADFTVGQLGEVASRFNYLIRPRTSPKKSYKDAPVLNQRVLQVDQMDELRRIWRTQELDPALEDLFMGAVFTQERPFVRAENVGRDELPGMEKFQRAPKSALEFQEFRVRATVANLGVKNRRSDAHGQPLPAEVLTEMSDFLLSWNLDHDPTWEDVAHAFDLDPLYLVAPTFDDMKAAKAPFDRTTRTIEKEAKQKKYRVVAQWWAEADAERRALFVEFLTNLDGETEDRVEESGLADVILNWPEDVLDHFMQLNFESGRSAYSVQSLEILNRLMRDEGLNLHQARMKGFGVTQDWKPSLPLLQQPTGQPTVDRVLAIVRKVIMAAHSRYGVPEAIYIEHARSALMGPAARDDYRKEVSRNTREREKQRQILREQGIAEPTGTDIRRRRLVEEQNCVCLYCGITIKATTGSCEIDHVVPRAGGGSNRRANLVAACRQCNAEKGKLPFAVFAQRTSRPGVSIAEAKDRIKNMRWTKATWHIRKELERRLAQTAEDDPIDERSLESTAYSAVEIRRRIERHFGDICERTGELRPDMFVFSGSITSEARKAGGVDSIIRLRGKEMKDRFDARHHAVDAAVMTLLDRSVAYTLQQRNEMRRAHILAGDEPGWKAFTGYSETARTKFDAWKKSNYKLAGMLKNAIENDSIPVIHPLRLTDKRGPLHKDGVKKINERIAVGAEWDRAQLEKVIDPYVHQALSEAMGDKDVLEASESRTLTVRGKVLGPNDVIGLLPGTAAAIEVNGGIVEIGESIHHARLYAWKDKKGNIKLGMVRVFTAEIPFLQKVSGVKDLFATPIHPSSLSFRRAQGQVIKQIQAGTAVEVGWITQGDEIELDVPRLLDDQTDFGNFLREFPEARWRVDGFYDARRLRIRPAFLSAEGLREDHSRVVGGVLIKGSVPSPASVFIGGKSVVIRRSALGVPRWRQSNGMPASFSPMREAERKLS